MFSSGEMLRLVSMITMLVVIAMLIMRARDPSVWRWLAGDDAADAQPEAAGKATPEAEEPIPGSQPSIPSPQSPTPAATGPTDQDYEEWEAFKEEVLAVDDFTFYFQREEMQAYDRLVRWALDQPFPVMWERAGKEQGKVVFNDFVQNRKQLRGKLVRLDLHLRRVLKMPEKTRDGAELHEAWGFTTQSGGWLYSVVIVDKPKDLPVGELVQQDVRVAGYFLKLLSYHSALSRPGDPPLYAPVLIGRVVGVKAPAPARSETAWFAESPTAKTVGVALFAAFVVAVAVWQLRGVLRRGKGRHGSMRRIETAIPRSGHLAVDDWLDRAGQRESLAGNNRADEDESVHRTAGRNGEANGHASLFGDGLDSGPAKSE